MKRSKRVKDLVIILLSAGSESRAKGLGSPALFDVGKSYLIDYQINVLMSIFEKCTIIPVLGFQSDLILSRMETKIGVLENQIYEDSNTSETLRIALNATTSDNLLIIHGNMMFDRGIFDNHSFFKPFVLYDERLSSNKVGLIENDEVLESLSYGLDKTWCNILFTCGSATQTLRQIVCKNKLHNRTMFEDINDLIKTEKVYAYQNNKPIVELNNKHALANIVKNESTPVFRNS